MYISRENHSRLYLHSAKQLSPEEVNVSYICSRYYRAPELIFGAQHYSLAIDIWSTGCVMAELFLLQPLFPGESNIDQLVEIIKILGTPTKDQLLVMNPSYSEHRFPQITAHPLSSIFGSATPEEAVQFLDLLLLYAPNDRLSATDALKHPYFDELKDPETRMLNGSCLSSAVVFHDLNY